jgi:hypothetical protein
MKHLVVILAGVSATGSPILSARNTTFRSYRKPARGLSYKTCICGPMRKFLTKLQSLVKNRPPHGLDTERGNCYVYIKRETGHNYRNVMNW